MRDMEWSYRALTPALSQGEREPEVSRPVPELRTSARYRVNAGAETQSLPRVARGRRRGSLTGRVRSLSLWERAGVRASMGEFLI